MSMNGCVHQTLPYARRVLPSLPTPGERNIAVRVTRDAIRHVRRGHPWIYDGSITKMSHDGAPGDLAIVFDDKRDFAAIGLWDPTSPIRVRVLSTTRATIGPEFFAQRFAEADGRRGRLLADGAVTGLRRVHGENDGLPALVIDQYATTFVVKVYSEAWFAHLADVVEAMHSTWAPEHLIVRLARNVQGRAPAGLADGTNIGVTPPPAVVPFLENGHSMTADPVAGQKTGYFLDQRANRKAFGALAADADVLDVFCCHGGFSVHAATGGARSVHSTDLSPHATASARKRVAANAPGTDHTITTGDAFEVMEQLAERRETFDLIVVDPPSFASRADAVPGALRAYTRLTHLALDLLHPGGVLMQASCTARIDTEMLEANVLNACDRAGREVEVLDLSEHDADHPIGFPEGAYLKAVTVRSTA